MNANLQTVEGKSISEASEVVSEQLKYVIGEIGLLRSAQSEPLDPSQAEHLRKFYENVETIKDNVNRLFTTASVRLESVQRGVKLRLMQEGQLA